MKLITEYISLDTQNVIKEETDGAKRYYIQGPFLQGDIKNRNGRIYPMPVLDKEVARYIKESIKENRAYGELGHPSGPTINLDRVSHMITELNKSGTDYVGKAKITNTPHGKIVMALIDDGAKLGISSRGMGSLIEEGENKVVGEDFMLATAGDIVADPSAPAAFVNGIMEDKEWIWDNGIIKEFHISDYKKSIEGAKRNKNELFVSLFEDFLLKISK